MLYLIIGLFAIAAVVGIVIFKNWITSANTSRTVIYLHGLFAVAGFVLLLVFALQNPENGLEWSLILFGAAALGGLYMFIRDMKGKFSPMWLATAHALLAVAAFVLLVFKIL